MSRVLVIGDVIDDIIVVPQGAIRNNTDTNASITQTLGGSAGNIASWAAHAGVDVTFIGCVGAKDAERVTSDFEAFGVHAQLQTSNTRHTGSLVALIEGEARTMLTDRGANQDLSFESLTIDYLSDYSYVFLSGYALFGRSEAEIKNFIFKVQDSGALLAIDPGSTGYIKDFGVDLFKSSVSGTDIMLPNEEEFDLLSTETAHITIVTKGVKGIDLYIEGIKTHSFDAPVVEAIDPTGAGDAFAGSLIAYLANGEELNSAIANAVKTAAKAVTAIGARPRL